MKIEHCSGDVPVQDVRPEHDGPDIADLATILIGDSVAVAVTDVRPRLAVFAARVLAAASATPIAAVIEMAAADKQAASYGIEYESVGVLTVTGPRARNRSFPHRVQVWDAADRTSNSVYRHVLSAESVVISSHPFPTAVNVGTVRIGDRVILVYPDGRLLTCEVQAMVAHDPHLVPLI